ncbi:MAG: hypothetical protein WCK08_01355 [Betaproteobacteria bacterium]
MVQDGFTDPGSCIMKCAGGVIDDCFNAQTTGDEAAHIVVSAEGLNASSDLQQPPKVLDDIQAHAWQQAEQLLADAGSCTEAVMAYLTHKLPQTD